MLVCCTGGEEGELQNPALREPGQPFHGLTPEQEKAKVAELRPAELARSAEIIGFDEVVMLGYRDSGHGRFAGQRPPRLLPPAELDEAVGRLVAVRPASQRPQVVLTYGDDQRGYPHPDHLRVHDISVLAFDRAGDPDWYPELGDTVAADEAVLLGVVEGAAGRRPRGDDRAARQVAVRRDWFDRPSQDHRITTRLDVGDFLWARSAALRAHATQVDPNGEVVVRALRRGARRVLPVGGLGPRPFAGRRPDARRARRRPVRRDPLGSDRCERAVPGRGRQEGRAGRGSRRCRRGDHRAARRRRTRSIRPSRSCRAG